MARYARMTPTRTGGRGLRGYGLSPFAMMDEMRREVDEMLTSHLGGGEAQG